MYVEDERGRQLHDRHTCGEQIDTAEMEELQAWYERKDSEEAALFEMSALRQDDALRARITQTERRILQLQDRIERQRKANKELEAEVRLLQATKSERVPTAA